MLNKQICRECYFNNIPNKELSHPMTYLEKNFEQRWSRHLLWCNVQAFNHEIIFVDSKVPENCVFGLEYILLRDSQNAK